MTPPPAVSCDDCGFHWNSTTMAEGLRLLGSCPKCGGVLRFRADADTGVPTGSMRPTRATRVAPHLVLGLPRKDTGF
jgi:hypothetical protein